MCCIKSYSSVAKIKIPTLVCQAGNFQALLLTYNVTVRRVPATIVAVEKQKVLHIYSECVFVALGIQHAKSMRYIVIFGMSVSTDFFHVIS